MSITRLLLINPNTSVATTGAMCRIASAATGAGVTITGLTARRGAALITNESALREAAGAVIELADDIAALESHGVIVSAFGDPALDDLRSILFCPVTGIAEAAMMVAAEDGRRFAVVTTTPDLADAIAVKAVSYGHAARFCGVFLTGGDLHAVMGDPARLTEALAGACKRAEAAGTEAIVIGGGPLAQVAGELQRHLRVPIIQPVPEAVRLAISRAARAEPVPAAARRR